MRGKEGYKRFNRSGSFRLKGWDYRSKGVYFVTFSTKGKKPYFGKIMNGVMELSRIGRIAHTYWQDLSDRHPFVKLDTFVVMPNHIHGIIVIDRNVARNVPPKRTVAGNINDWMSSISPKPGSLSTIIRSYKSAVTKDARKIDPDFTWQARFHDRIIHNPEQQERIRQYIQKNPAKWDEKQ